MRSTMTRRTQSARPRRARHPTPPSSPSSCRGFSVGQRARVGEDARRGVLGPGTSGGSPGVDNRREDAPRCPADRSGDRPFRSAQVGLSAEEDEESSVGPQRVRARDRPSRRRRRAGPADRSRGRGRLCFDGVQPTSYQSRADLSQAVTPGVSHQGRDTNGCLHEVHDHRGRDGDLAVARPGGGAHDHEDAEQDPQAAAAAGRGPDVGAAHHVALGVAGHPGLARPMAYSSVASGSGRGTTTLGTTRGWIAVATAGCRGRVDQFSAKRRRGPHRAALWWRGRSTPRTARLGGEAP